MKNIKRILCAFVCLLIALTSLTPVRAAAYIDEITDYEITVTVNDDGTLNLVYHIEWLILDDEEGPLIWAEIGIPNSHYISYEALTDNIESIYYKSGSGVLHMDFNHDYYKGETAVFEFRVHQDYMYAFYEGNDYAVFQFTPAWFDYADVDRLVIRWANENVDSYSPAAQVEADWLVF